MMKLHFLLAFVFLAIGTYACSDYSDRNNQQRQDENRGVPSREPSEVKTRP